MAFLPSARAWDGCLAAAAGSFVALTRVCALAVGLPFCTAALLGAAGAATTTVGNPIYTSMAPSQEADEEWRMAVLKVLPSA